MDNTVYSIDEVKNTLLTILGPGEMLDLIISDLEKKERIKEGSIVQYWPIGDVAHVYFDEAGLKTTNEVSPGEVFRVITTSETGLCHVKAPNGIDVFANLQHFTVAEHALEKKYLYDMVNALRSTCSPIINYFALTEFYQTIKDSDTKQQMADILDKEMQIAKVMSRRIKKLF